MRSVLAVFFAAAIAFAPSAEARRGAGLPDKSEANPYELVVFEADGCVYCEVFRTDVLPLYKSSQIGRETPIRFINVSRSDESGMRLSSAITVAPTVVLMHQGQEVDRIIGYTGPFNFMKLVAYMMGRGE